MKETAHRRILTGSNYGVNGQRLRQAAILQQRLYDASEQHMEVISSNAHGLGLVLNSVAVSKHLLYTF